MFPPPQPAFFPHETQIGLFRFVHEKSVFCLQILPKFLFVNHFLIKKKKILIIILLTDIGEVAVVQTRKMKKKKHVED
jgi:hypothetical protein